MVLKIAASENEIYDNNLVSHKIREEILRGDAWCFEMISDIIIGEHKHSTALMFEIIQV